MLRTVGGQWGARWSSSLISKVKNAVRAQDGDMMREVVASYHGADEGRILEAAVREGSADACRVLINDCKLSPNAVIGKARENALTSPLHVAARLGYRDVCAALIDGGAEVNYVNIRGNTPLHEASLHGHHDITSLLVEQGAVKTPQRSGASFSDSLNFFPSNYNTRKTLSTMGEVELTSILFNAARNNTVDEVEAVLAQRICPNTMRARYSIAQQTALHVAAMHGSLDVCKSLISFGASINIQSSSGTTPLILALRGQHTSVAEYLLRQGALKSYGGKESSSPLVQYGSPSYIPISDHTIKEIAALSRGARNTAFIQAVTRNVVDEVKALLSAGSSTETTCLRTGMKALHIAAAADNLSLCEVLLEHGADINGYSSGLTPLAHAASVGSGEAVSFLLQNGAVKCASRVVWHGLHSVMKEDVAHLVTHGARGYIPARSATQQAIMKMKPCARESVFLYAAAHGVVDELLMVLDTGMDVGVMRTVHITEHTKAEVTALHLAAWSGNVDMCKILLTAGISPNAAGKEGRTPLMVAAENGRREVVKLLIEEGAAKGLNDAKGMVAVSFSKDVVIDEMLLWYGEKEYVRATGATVEEAKKLSSDRLIDAIMYAATNNCLDELNRLIPIGTSPDFVAEWLGKTGVSSPLHVLAASTQYAACGLFIKYGANVNFVNSEGHTPLMVAAEYNNPRILHLLMSRGALKSFAVDGVLPCMMGRRGTTTRKMLTYDDPSYFPVNKDARRAIRQLPDDEKTRVLFYAAAYGYVDELTCALKTGARPRALTWNGEEWDPLHLAVERGHLAVVEVFTDSFPEMVNLVFNGESLLVRAQKMGNLRMMKLLVGKGAMKCLGKITEQNVRGRSKKAVTKAVTFGTSSYLSCTGWFALLAVKMSMKERHRLIFQTIKLNLPDELEAIWRTGCSLECIFPVQQCDEMLTPLQYAAFLNRYACTKLLVELGAKKNKLTVIGQHRAIDLTTHPDVRKYLGKGSRRHE